MLFAAPQVIDAEIFSSMPARWRKTGQRSDWADANKGGDAIDSFLEGPSFDRGGNLYVTDIPFGRIFRISRAGEWQLAAEYDGWPNGLKFLPDGRALITDYRHGLMQLDPATGKVAPFLTHRNTESFKGVNDLYVAANGDVWFTDQGQTGLHDPSGRVYRLRPDGRLDQMLANVPSPNGIVLDATGKVLYVAATRGNCIWRGPLMPDGSVSKVGNFFQLYGPTGPDGLALDEAGNLLIAHPGSGSVIVLDSHAEPIVRVKGPAGSFITNLAFGYDAAGQTDDQLYMTDSANGNVLRARMPRRGHTLSSHAAAGPRA